MFFAFDGIDGVGKSTQVRLLADWLRGRGYEVVECRDPGSTPTGEHVRRLLLDQRSRISLRAEALLYMAARAQLVDEVIQPALTSGHVVVSDRYLLSNVVYQGHAGGLDVDVLWRLGQMATAGIRPDRTFLLDLSVSAAAARMNRPLDRLEQRGAEYSQKLRDGFLAEAARPDSRIVVIDAAAEPQQVHEAICAEAEPLLRRP